MTVFPEPPSIWTDGANQRTGKRPPVLLQALGAGPKVATGIQRPPGGVKFLPDFFSEQETDIALGFGYLCRLRGPIGFKPTKTPPDRRDRWGKQKSHQGMFW